MLKTLESLESRVVSENPYWTYKQDLYLLPNGREAQYYYASTPGSVFVVARDAEGRFVMTRQYRYLNRRISTEFPGGGLPKGQDPLIQAQKELQEETGYTARTWHRVGEFNPMNGLSDEICHVFLAQDLDSGTATPEESEEIELHHLRDSELRQAVRTNVIWDGMTLAAWSLYIHSEFYDV